MSQLTDNLNQIVSIKSEIKDAIEAKGVDMTGVSFPDYPDKIGEIQAGGGDLTQQDVTERNFTWSVINNRASFVGSYIYSGNSFIQMVNLPECETVYNNAFDFCPNISEISLPVCKQIGYYAFEGCFSLKSISLPECLNIGNYGFIRCSSLEYVYLPNCSVICYSTFAECTSISYASLPKCERLSDYAFARCRSLEDVSIPVCRDIWGYAFISCSSLISIYLPVCSSIGQNAFANCYSLRDVSIPFVQFISQYGFLRCSSISEISLPLCSVISNMAFSGCLLLSQMTLGTETYIVASYGNNCLSGTPLVNGVGSIYVPACNYDKYVVANGWSSISARIVSVGDPTDYLLSYDNGLVYGRTKLLDIGFYSRIGVSSSSVISINLPDCDVIQIGNAFIYNSPFRDCRNIKTVDLGCTNVNSYMFSGMINLEYVNLPSCTNVSTGGFMYCSKLKTVNLPQCSYIGSSAFYSSPNLKSIDLPLCTYVSNSAFHYCLGLSYVNLPVCSYIAGNAFNNCKSLPTIDLPVCSYIGDRAFGWCSDLKEIVLRYDGVCEISDQTFIDAWLDYIYVPESLVSDYKVAQYWSSMSNKIYSILPDLGFSNGLVYGWASSLSSGYLNELGISAGDVTGVSMSRLMSVASSTFMNHQNLVYVDIPLVGEYPDDMFNGTGLSEFSISASTLGNRVFANCSGLEKVTIDYNGIVNAGSNLFQNCTNLSQIVVPFMYYSDYQTASGWSEYSSLMYQEIPLLAFNNGMLFGSISSIGSDYRTILGYNISSNAVLEIYLPNCKYVGSSTFYSHQRLVSVDLPKCSYIGYGAFREDNKIESITIPKCEYIGDTVFQGAFQNNTTGRYMTLDLPVCSYIGYNAFYWTQRSWTITLGSTNVCSMNDYGGLTNATTVDSIYVPASLVESYKSTYPVWNSKIFPIPE